MLSLPLWVHPPASNCQSCLLSPLSAACSVGTGRDRAKGRGLGRRAGLGWGLGEDELGRAGSATCLNVSLGPRWARVREAEVMSVVVVRTVGRFCVRVRLDPQPRGVLGRVGRSVPTPGVQWLLHFQRCSPSTSLPGPRRYEV